MSQVLLSNGGIGQLKGFGSRRLKAVLFLSQHPELDGDDWTGRVELHVAGRFVKGAAIPALEEIRLPELAA